MIAARSAPDAEVVRRVRWRLAAWSGGATLIVIVALGLAIYAAVAGSLASSGRQQLDARATAIQDFLASGRGGPGERPPIEFAFGGATSGTFGFVVTPANLVYGPRDFSNASLPNADGIEVARAGRTDVREVEASQVPLRVLSEPVTGRDGVYLVQVAQDTTAERRTLGVLTGVLLVGGVLAVLGAIAVGAFYADRALVPIREALRRQREFAADASHELRTPLAVLRSAVEYVERHPEQRVGEMGEVVADMHDEVDQMTALVGDLLLLARTDSGAVDVEHIPLDLADVATDALSSVSALAAAREVRLTLDPSPAPVLGDPQRLRQLVTILADNAISHSPADGAVTVRVRSSGRMAALLVEDEGPGIRPEDLPRVFDRFWRAPDAPAEGTGLGLAIAAWIVERHDGTIEAANREGGGAAFSVRIPLDRTRVPPSHASISPGDGSPSPEATPSPEGTSGGSDTDAA
jgi:two-component system, OmpR family, sensor histidine kinase CiaH